MKNILLALVILVMGCSAEGSLGERSTPGEFIKTMPADNAGSSGSSLKVPPSGNNGASGQNWQVVLPDTGPAIEVDSGTCGSVTVKADVEVIQQPGNLLVIFDRSGSMDQAWGAVPKYQAAGEAIMAALTPMQDSLTVGAILFPSLPTGEGTSQCNIIDWTHWLPGGPCLSLATGSCAVSDISSPDQISFRSGAEFISELPNQWLLFGATGTPLQGGVEKADAALASTDFEGQIAIVIMTDGEPNCETNTNVVNDYVAQWAASGIKTYVVGLPGSNVASSFLTSLAVTGGTDRFIEPDDPTALQNEIATIVTETIQAGLSSCVINLEQTEDTNVDDLHLVVMEQGVEMQVPKQISGGGWSISADGMTATLEGSLCNDAQSGRFESVSFSFGCIELPIYVD